MHSAHQVRRGREKCFRDGESSNATGIRDGSSYQGPRADCSIPCQTSNQYVASIKQERSLTSFISERVVTSTNDVTLLTAKLRTQRDNVRDAFLIETREAQKKHDLEESQRRDREERQKAKEKAKLEQDDDERTLRHLLSSNDSLYRSKRSCIPGTRVSILSQLVTWVTESSQAANRLFWLYGVAGCGKSAVAASISQDLDGRGRLTGSFFCKREEEDRRDPRRLFGHVAYFLASGNAVFKRALLRSLKDPQSSVIKNDHQAFIDLILNKPLAELKQSTLDSALVIIIDALDECNDPELASRHLALICSVASWVKIIVTSRDLPEIRGALKTCTCRSEYSLFDDDARNDIRKLLDKELEPEGRLARMSWFIEMRKEAFVDFSQGLFIWLDTIIAFIATEGNLDAVEKVLVQASRPEAEASLDILYQAVIKSATEKTKTSKVVVPLIIASSTTRPLMPRVIHALLPPSLLVTLDDVEFSLAHLNAILVRRDHGIVAAHISILDFGADRKRCSDDIWEDPAHIQQIMATGCLEIMRHGTRNAKRLPTPPPPGLRFNICNLETSYLKNTEVPDLDRRIEENISPELLYSTLFWFSHLVDYSGTTGSMEEVVSQSPGSLELSHMLTDFLPTERSLYWLEVLSLTNNLERAVDSLTYINDYSYLPVSSCPSNSSMNSDDRDRRRYLVRSLSLHQTWTILWSNVSAAFAIALPISIFV